MMIRYLLALLLLAAGCRRTEVAHYQVKKSAGPSALAVAGMPGPATVLTSTLTWTLPKGWTETRAEGVRYATLKPAAPGKVDVSVVVLPGPAGGELANVNRWRGQIGLAAILVSEESTWFIKMLGDENPVASARGAFLHHLGSLRFDAAN